MKTSASVVFSRKRILARQALQNAQYCYDQDKRWDALEWARRAVEHAQLAYDVLLHESQLEGDD